MGWPFGGLEESGKSPLLLLSVVPGFFLPAFLASSAVILRAGLTGGASRRDNPGMHLHLVRASIVTGALLLVACGSGASKPMDGGIDGAAGAGVDRPGATPAVDAAPDRALIADAPVGAMDGPGLDTPLPPAPDAGAEASPSERPTVDGQGDAPADRASPDAPLAMDASVDAPPVPVVPASNRGTGGVPGTDRPGHRYGHAMAYDQARARMVVFGGTAPNFYCATGLCNDVWEWDGAAGLWQKRTPAGGAQPSPRTQHAMVYDPVAKRVLVFGGSDGSFRQDLWQWDGAAATWTDVTPAGAKPSPRQNAGLVWDSARNRAVLFGGGETDGANPKSDTWEWDGVTWADRTGTPAPPARQGHGMAFHPAGRKVLMFGGSNGSGYLGDTWVYDGSTGAWSPLTTAGPSPRFFPRMEYDSQRGRVVLYGGATAGFVASPEIWEAGLDGWSGPATTLPMPGRAYHSMAHDPVRGRLVVFAGSTAGGSQTLDDLWEL
jgi:hypothetical protein